MLLETLIGNKMTQKHVRNIVGVKCFSFDSVSVKYGRKYVQVIELNLKSAFADIIVL